MGWQAKLWSGGPSSLRTQVAKQDAQQVRVVVRRARHERDNLRVFNVSDVRPEPVEAQREGGLNPLTIEVILIDSEYTSVLSITE
jgi:hypothetical protein